MVRSVLTSFIATKNCFTVNRAHPSLMETDDWNSKQDKKINFKDVRWPSVSWKSHRVCSIEGQNRKEVQVLNKQINLVLCSLLMIGMKAPHCGIESDAQEGTKSLAFWFELGGEQN